MDLYIGTKLVNAKPMNRLEYSNFRGWEVPLEENPLDPGYLVEYLDGGPANTETYKGYVSWSPESVFLNAYQRSGQLSFGHAIEFAKQGYKIARQGWNGKNMFVAYMPALKLPPYSSNEPGPKVNSRTARFIGEDTPLDCQPYFAMFNAQQQWIPGWLASQSDMLAEDWIIVENN